MLKNSSEFPSDLSLISQCRRSFEHRSVVVELLDVELLSRGYILTFPPSYINSSFSSMAGLGFAIIIVPLSYTFCTYKCDRLCENSPLRARFQNRVIGTEG